MDEGLQAMIFMGLVLKIPVAFACWIIWWAIKSEPEPAEAPEDGGNDRSALHFRRRPKRPKGPRRGPHTPDSLPLPCPKQGSLRVVRQRTLRERLARGATEPGR